MHEDPIERARELEERIKAKVTLLLWKAAFYATVAVLVGVVLALFLWTAITKTNEPIFPPKPPPEELTPRDPKKAEEYRQQLKRNAEQSQRLYEKAREQVNEGRDR